MRSNRARRNVALVAKARPTYQFSAGALWILDRGQRMLELWNNWYETLGLAEALAIVIVFVVAGAGVIALAQGRRR